MYVVQNIEFTFHRPLTSVIKNSRVEEGPSCMNSVWCSLLKYADGLSVNKFYLFWDTKKKKKNVLDLHHDEKKPLHSRGAGGRGEVGGWRWRLVGGRGGVLLRHETEAYVTVIFVINIHNGNILWEDFYHKWVQTAVRPSQWNDRGALSQRETVLMNNLILKVIVNGKQKLFCWNIFLRKVLNSLFILRVLGGGGGRWSTSGIN